MRINLKSIITCLILAVIILFLIFCERSEAAPKEEENNLLSGKWKISGEPIKNISLYYSNYVGSLFNDSYTSGVNVSFRDEDGLHTAFGSKFYYISNLSLVQDNSYAFTFVQRIQTYDCNTNELTTNFCIEDIVADSLNVSNGKEVLFYRQASDGLTKNYASILLEDGKLLKGIDTEAYIQSDMLAGRKPQREMTVYEEATDRFISVCTGGEIVLTDRLGHLLSFTLGKKGVTQKPLFQTRSGVWIFKAIYSSNEVEYFYFDDYKPITLYAGPNLYIGKAIEDNDGNIIYRKIGEGDFIRWNVKTGEREIICSFEPRLVRDADMVINDSGDLYVYTDNDLRIFSKEVKTRTIHVQQFANRDHNIERAMKEYEQTHPGVTFEYVKIDSEGEREERAQKSINSMKAGAVDIAFLDNETFSDYVKADCIRDISDIYTEVDKENMFDSFRDASTVDGKMLRYPSFYNRDLLIAKSGVLSKPYSATELVNLLDKKEAAGHPYEALCYGCEDPFEIFLAGMDVSEFFDYKKGCFNFTTDNFVKILKQCKKYYYASNNAPLTEKEQYNKLLQDKVLFVNIGSVDLSQFNSMKSILGENAEIAGYPTKAQSGNITAYNKSLVVSKTTKNYDIISDFLKYVYKYYWGPTIYNFIPTDKVSFDGIVMEGNDEHPTDERAYQIPDGYELITSYELKTPMKPVIYVMPNGVMDLAQKEDGTSYVDEYKNYYETIRLADPRFEPIKKILQDEIESMYKNNTDEKEVAKKIQRQVSEYLKTFE